jgi:hypothetical protein
MPAKTIAQMLAPIDPHSISCVFGYLEAMHAGDDYSAELIAMEADDDMHRLLLWAAAHIILPVTAVDNSEGDPCADSFLAAALGELLLDVLSSDGDVCPTRPHVIARAINRFVEEVLTDDPSDVPQVLSRMEDAAVDEAMKAYREEPNDTQSRA